MNPVEIPDQPIDSTLSVTKGLITGAKSEVLAAEDSKRVVYISGKTAVLHDCLWLATGLRDKIAEWLFFQAGQWP